MLFDNHFQRDAEPAATKQDVGALAALESGANGLAEFLAVHAGGSFGVGLYRVHPVAEMQRWTEIVGEAFPDFRQRIFCFGFDWLGRMLAVDFARKVDGQ